MTAVTPPKGYCLAAILAAVVLHGLSLVSPCLYTDDFGMSLSSWTWAETRKNLFVPTNEHCIPFWRLTTYLLQSLAGKPTLLPLVYMLFTHLMPIVTMLLLYRFVQREQLHPIAAPVAMVLFGVSSAYSEAVFWYGGSPPVPVCACGLLALLAAQSFLRSGRRWWLLASAIAMLVAPGFLASGVLFAPVLALYLIGRGFGSARWWAWLIPPLGTMFFLVVSLSQSASQIVNADHFGGKTLPQAFSVQAALLNTGRSIVDQQLLGSFGLWGIPVPEPYAYPLFGVMLIGLAWWFYRAPNRRFILIGIALIVLNDLLIFGARAGWSYETQLCLWTRYQVLPQLGLALVVAGGIGSRKQPVTPHWHWRYTQGLLIILVVQFLVQLPRGWFSAYPRFAEQQSVLWQIEQVEGICQKHNISQADLLKTLPHSAIPGSADHNRWLFVRGSATPVSHSPEQLQQLLAEYRDSVP